MTVFTQQITSSVNNGVLAHYGGGSESYYTNQLYVGYGSDGSWYKSAFRFTDVSIPQGATIVSAILTTRNWDYSAGTWNFVFKGIAEDNTADLSSSPFGRSTTSASVNWDHGNFPYTSPYNQMYDTPDLKDIVQEIVNRGGWSSGNALAIEFLSRNTGQTGYIDILPKDNYHPEQAAYITITYTTGGSPSVSPSASISQSYSPSSSQSPSASISPSASVSMSASASPSPEPTPYRGLVISKPGANVLTNSDVEKKIFDSQFGTLKYFAKIEKNISFDASAGDISAVGTYTHNLNKYLYCETYVRVYTGDTPSGNYEYCPFFGSGVSVAYSANVKIGLNDIKVYGEISGVSSAVWHFDFLIFVFKNELTF